MDKKKVPTIQDFSMNEAAVGKYDLLKEYDVELDVVQGAHDISKDEFMNRFPAFGTKGPDASPAGVEMVEKMCDAHIVISHSSPVSIVAVKKAENLETVCILCNRVENVGLKAASRKGTKVSNVPGRLTVVVSELIVSMICAETKNVARTHANVMKGVWENRYHNSEYAITLGRRNVGLAGCRTISTRVVGMMVSFDANTLVYDPYTPEDKTQGDGYEPVGPNELYSRSDVISIHYRLTPGTENMIGGGQFGLMRPHAFLINSARAGLVDEECLIDALKNHRTDGATLDVFHGEPLGPDSPYLKMDNVTLAPHTVGTASNLGELTFDIMEYILRHCFETGEWTHVIN